MTGITSVGILYQLGDILYMKEYSHMSKRVGQSTKQKSKYAYKNWLHYLPINQSLDIDNCCLRRLHIYLQGENTAFLCILLDFNIKHDLIHLTF